MLNVKKRAVAGGEPTATPPPATPETGPPRTMPPWKPWPSGRPAAESESLPTTPVRLRRLLGQAEDRLRWSLPPPPPAPPSAPSGPRRPPGIHVSAARLFYAAASSAAPAASPASPPLLHPEVSLADPASRAAIERELAALEPRLDTVSCTRTAPPPDGRGATRAVSDGAASPSPTQVGTRADAAQRTAPRGSTSDSRRRFDEALLLVQREVVRRSRQVRRPPHTDVAPSPGGIS